MKVKSIKRLETLSHNKNTKQISMYYIDKGHINYYYDNGKCILCGKVISSNDSCPNKLDSIGLKIFMDESDKVFCLFLEPHFGGNQTIEETGYADIDFTFYSEDEKGNAFIDTEKKEGFCLYHKDGIFIKDGRGYYGKTEIR